MKRERDTVLDGNDPHVVPERAVPVCELGVPGGLEEGPVGVPCCGGDRVQGSDAWGMPSPPTASPLCLCGSALPEDVDGTGCAHSCCPPPALLVPRRMPARVRPLLLGELVGNTENCLSNQLQCV